MPRGVDGKMDNTFQKEDLETLAALLTERNLWFYLVKRPFFALKDSHCVGLISIA
jgi:hypothetical protein